MKQRNLSELLLDANASINLGGQETLYHPPFFKCANQTHYPFRLLNHPNELDSIGNYFSGSVYKFGEDQYPGDRTDLYDMWSLSWAAFLRAIGISSPWLIDDIGFCHPEELQGRDLIIQPSTWNLKDDEILKKAHDALRSWTAFGYHLLDLVFDWHQKGDSAVSLFHHEAVESATTWIEPVFRTLRSPKHYSIIERIQPTWTYFSDLQRGITVAQLQQDRMDALKFVLKPFAPLYYDGKNALLVQANGIENGIPLKTVRLAKCLMKLTNEPFDSPTILPLNSHCIFLGDRTLIAIRDNCGSQNYVDERENFLKMRSAGDNFFCVNSYIEWNDQIDSQDFEDLCAELLRREPGVRNVQTVGNTHDRDGGADMLVNWVLPYNCDGSNESATENRKVVVQVKFRRRTIGKRYVQDIRDTLDRYNASGFLLIALPKISSDLVRHLDHMSDKHGLYIDSWEKQDLEVRMRGNSDIIKRYPQVAKISEINENGSK